VDGKCFEVIGCLGYKESRGCLHPDRSGPFDISEDEETQKTRITEPKFKLKKLRILTGIVSSQYVIGQDDAKKVLTVAV